MPFGCLSHVVSIFFIKNYLIGVEWASHTICWMLCWNSRVMGKLFKTFMSNYSMVEFATHSLEFCATIRISSLKCFKSFPQLQYVFFFSKTFWQNAFISIIAWKCWYEKGEVKFVNHNLTMWWSCNDFPLAQLLFDVLQVLVCSIFVSLWHSSLVITYV